MSGVVAVDWQRLNRRMLVVHPVVEVAKALPALAVAVLAGRGSVGGAVWALGIAVIVAALGVVRWFTTWYRITAQRIELRRGLFRRRTLTAPLDRIRTVDVTSHPLHRLMGLARVVIRAGTTDRKNDDAVVLDGLTAGEAAGLRERLLHRRPLSLDKPGADAPSAAVLEAPAVAPGTTHEDELARLDRRWLRYAPFSLFGFVSGLVVVGLVWRVISEAHLDVRSIGFVRAVLERVDRWPVAWTVVAACALVLVFVVLASTVGYVLAFWNFRLTRHPGGSIHVSRGLLTTRATSIERRRLRGAEISEPLLLRSVGGARCLAIATGLRTGRGAERGGEVLLPPAPAEVATAVAADVMEDATPVTVPLVAHPVHALRRRLVRSVGASLVLVAAALVAGLLLHWPVWVFVAIAVPVLAAAGWLGVDRYRSLGHAIDDRYAVTRFGGIVRRRCMVEVDGVIGCTIRRSFFQRRLGLATVHLTTAAGRQEYPIVDVTADEAVRCSRTVLPAVLDEFLVDTTAALTPTT